MKELRGFLKVARQNQIPRAVCERVKDFKEVGVLVPEKASEAQAFRCMDCATPFCHWGCPIGNYIPEWNDYTSRGKWVDAFILLNATNNLPEITGRICPALCEYSCVLGINDDAVAIRENELAIIEHGFKKGLIKPFLPKNRTGKSVAVVGSGPAGLSCAAGLNRAGHKVVIFERDSKPGGILRYGIPDFKLEKHLIDRRIDIWKKEGIIFKTNTDVGKDYPAKKLLNEFDAVVLAGGSRVPRDLKIEGRNLKGIYFAMDYLTQSNKRVSGEKIIEGELIDAKNKRVVVIGGGDTGADCVGTAHRQGAKCVIQIEVMPKPSECRNSDYPWPKYPLILKQSSSHEEGGLRQWAVLTKRFVGEKGSVKKLSSVRVEFLKSDINPDFEIAKSARRADRLNPIGFNLARRGNPEQISNAKIGINSCPIMKEIPGSEFEIEADMVIIAVGFLYPERSGLLSELGVTLDERGNVKSGKNYMTSVDKIFSAGDMRKGQSLVVWAIAEGRRAAYCVDKYLMGSSELPLL